MTVNDLRVRDENIDEDADVAAYTSEGVNNSDPDNTAIPWSDDRSVIITSTFFSPEILKRDNRVTLKEKRQLHLSI
jgi:hypothetical protein